MVEERIDAIDFYIHATSTPADDRTRVLKHGESFAVFNRYGDIRPLGLGEQGIYHGGTRYLSRFVMTIENGPPILLSSTMRRDDLMLTVDVTNMEVRRDNEVLIPQDTIHISRSTLIWDGVCHQQLQITNYGDHEADLRLGFVYDADYADIFEVRGMKRKNRGELEPVETDERGAKLSYCGLDGVRRTTRITCTPSPDKVSANQLALSVHLMAGEQRAYEVAVVCEDGDVHARPTFDEALAAAEEGLCRSREREAHTITSNEQFNDWLDRSLADVRVLTSRTSDGYYPYAGVPWFSTPFGRDGLIAALQMIWVNPDLARGVLGYLAAHQAQEYDPEADAQPGKILHETRTGEMAALGEHPFRKYYGSADATPLFVMLAGAYYRATADRDFISSIWPNIQAALEWIDGDGDPDNDGFVEYSKSPVGLVHQGWKDSNDSVFHLDGSPASHPIALAEVQGYVFAAKRSASGLSSVLGDDDTATRLSREAEQLRKRFESAFWSNQLSCYAEAIDGEHRPCLVLTSNPGHCLYAGIVSDERASALADQFMSPEMFSGWGIRTLASNSVRYNPMSYHNGSVWPHDNAIIAAGLARYGYKDQAAEVLNGLFNASHFLDLRRMPELLCGFERHPGAGPTLYPVACLPQAWAAGAVFMILGACLGLEIDAPNRQLRIVNPVLPEYLDEVTITDLRVGDVRVDLAFHRHARDTSVNVLRRSGALEIMILK